LTWKKIPNTLDIRNHNPVRNRERNPVLAAPFRKASEKRLSGTSRSLSRFTILTSPMDAVQTGGDAIQRKIDRQIRMYLPLGMALPLEIDRAYPQLPEFPTEKR